MKILLSLCIVLASPFASAKRDLSGPEAFGLFKKMVFQLKVDTNQWLARSQKDLADYRKASATSKACLSGEDTKCETAIREVSPAAVVPIQDRFIFQLDEDLKTKYSFDVETGMKIFKLSTGLRWIARKDLYNGVRAPQKANRKTYAAFLSQIESFHKEKALDLKKADPMIPPAVFRGR